MFRVSFCINSLIITGFIYHKNSLEAYYDIASYILLKIKIIFMSPFAKVKKFSLSNIRPVKYVECHTNFKNIF